MTKDQKLVFVARMFMYGAKVGYDADIDEVEYFIRAIADDMGVKAVELRTSDYINKNTAELLAPAEETFASIRQKLIGLNP